MVPRPEPVTLTLDTNVIRDAVDPTRDQGLRDRGRRLLDLHWARECDIALTTVVDFDVPGGWLAEAIRLLILNKEPSILRVGRSRVGDDVISDEELRKLTDEIEKIIGSKNLADVDHVVAHYLSGRYAFVTRDKDILNRRDELRTKFGIRVMRPRQAIAHTERLHRTRSKG